MAAKIKNHVVYDVTHPMIDGQFQIKVRIPNVEERAQIMKMGEDLKVDEHAVGDINQAKQDALAAFSNFVKGLCVEVLDVDGTLDDIEALNQYAFMTLMSKIGIELAIGLAAEVEVKRKN